MLEPRLAAWLDSYRTDLKSALGRAAADQYRWVEANFAGEELDPRRFDASARRHLKRYLRDLGLSLDGLVLELPGRGLADPACADARLDRFRRGLEMCAHLGVRRAGVTLSGFQDDRSQPLACELLDVVADLADRVGVQVAVHTGTEPPQAAAEAIRRLDCPSLRLDLDTAHLLPAGPDVASWAGLAGAAWVRDLRRVGARVEEVPFGTGEVDFGAFLKLLDAADFSGPLVVRRDSPGAGVDALREGREYIEALAARAGSG